MAIAEVVEDESITSGAFVPKAWREFYDDVERRVSDFLDSLFGPDTVGPPESVPCSTKSGGQKFGLGSGDFFFSQPPPEKKVFKSEMEIFGPIFLGTWNKPGAGPDQHPSNIPLPP